MTHDCKAHRKSQAGWGQSDPVQRKNMSRLRSQLDTTSDTYRASRDTLLEQLREVNSKLAVVLAGGGAQHVKRHRERGKLLVRERIEFLLDRDSAFLELSPLAGHDTGDPLGAGLVTGIGVVNGVECLIGANDPTVKGGTSSPTAVTKQLRALEIARRNRLPVINLKIGRA